MGSVIVIRARRWAYGFAVGAATALVMVAPASGSHRLTVGDARDAARDAVLTDSTYRIIDSSEPLRTRHCWRAAGRVVHCSLVRTAPTPCALKGGTPAGTLCAQVLASRTWLVEIGPRRAAPAPLPVRILRVVDGPA